MELRYWSRTTQCSFSGCHSVTVYGLGANIISLMYFSLLLLSLQKHALERKNCIFTLPVNLWNQMKDLSTLQVSKSSIRQFEKKELFQCFIYAVSNLPCIKRGFLHSLHPKGEISSTCIICAIPKNNCRRYSLHPLYFSKWFLYKTGRRHKIAMFDLPVPQIDHA